MISRTMAIRTLALAVAGGAGLLVALGMLGGQFQRLDAFAAFRWHACMLLVFALAVVLWPRRALPIAVLAPVVILGVPVVLAHGPVSGAAKAMSAAALPGPSGPGSQVPGRPAPGARIDGGVAPLRVMTFNTWDDVQNIDAISALLRRTLPDVVVLVEVSPPKRAVLDVLRPLYPHQVECAAHWPCSMALLSRLPFKDKGTVMPNAHRPSTVWGRIDTGIGDTTIVGVHIHRPTRSPRIHFGHIRGLAEFLREIKGPVVVAGDFNTPAWAASMTWLLREAGLRAMPQTLPTWPAWPVAVPQFPIDHILVSAQLRLVDVATTDAAGSDHLPILATLSAASPPPEASPPAQR